MRKRMLLLLTSLLIIAAVMLSGCEGDQEPVLSVSPTTLFLDQENTQSSVTIENTGGGELVWEVTANRDWLTVEPASGTDDEIVNVIADPEGLAPGSHNAILSVTSNGGSAEVNILLSLSETQPLGQVENLDVRGITAPEELDVAMAANQAKIKLLLKEVDKLNLSPTFKAMENEGEPVAPGFVTGFILSWDPVEGADGYEILRLEENDYQLFAQVPEAELDDPTSPTYIYLGEYMVGDSETFRVRAYRGEEKGEASAADSGVIISATQPLYTPGNNTSTSATPTFTWEANLDGVAYMLALNENFVDNRIWTYVTDDNETTTVVYPEDDVNAPELSSGPDYLWFVTTFGPVDADGKTDALSLSKTWSFYVGN